MIKIHLDKIASSTRNASIASDVRVSPEVIAQEGYVVAARVLERKTIYNEIEDLHGRMVKINEGDLVAGVLGARKALRGFAGYVPSSISAGETLSLLNLGGVIGKCESTHPELGSPTRVEILGSILMFPSIEERVGVPAHIRRGSVEWADHVGHSAPIIYVSGTCMSTGKTTACTEIVRELSHRGHRVAAAKLTGVSLLRDTLSMEDAGAIKSLNFTDAGVASTTDEKVLPVAKGIIKALQSWKPDILVVELGDGIAGEYGVQTILKDRELMSFSCGHVVCASDPVSAWGAARMFTEKFQLPIALMSGPATDNDVGKTYIQQTLGIPAFNARTHSGKLVDFLVRPQATPRPKEQVAYA